MTIVLILTIVWALLVTFALCRCARLGDEAEAAHQPKVQGPKSKVHTNGGAL